MENKEEKLESFEAAMERLDAIVRSLENGKNTLDEAIKLYEEGVKLVGVCTAALENAKQKLTVVTTAEPNNDD